LTFYLNFWIYIPDWSKYCEIEIFFYDAKLYYYTFILLLSFFLSERSKSLLFDFLKFRISPIYFYLYAKTSFLSSENYYIF